MTERLLNTANKAASEKRFGPDSPGYRGDQERGPVSTALGGGSSLLMSSRPHLATRPAQSESEPAQEVMATIGTSSESPKTVDVVRSGSTYSVMSVGENGEATLTNLDPFGNQPTKVDIDGSEVGVSYSPDRDLLVVTPGSSGSPAELLLTFSN